MFIYNRNDGSTGRNISTSKGNQLKEKIGNTWYKVDFLGYEGAAEYLASENFLAAGEEIITADKLYKQNFGKSLESILKDKSLDNKIKYFVEETENITKIKEFGKYLTMLFEFDGFILNEDRHFNNIGFIRDLNGNYKTTPIFDNGASFLSDIREDYPMERNIFGAISSVQSKPFSKQFDSQIEICEKLYGKQLKLNKELFISDEVKKNIFEMYGDRVLNRLIKIFEHQKYIYSEMLVLDKNLSQNKKTELGFKRKSR